VARDAKARSHGNGSVRGGQWRRQPLAIADGGTAADSVRRGRGGGRDGDGARDRQTRVLQRYKMGCCAARARALLMYRVGAGAGGPGARGPARSTLHAPRAVPFAPRWPRTARY